MSALASLLLPNFSSIELNLLPKTRHSSEQGQPRSKEKPSTSVQQWETSVTKLQQCAEALLAANVKVLVACSATLANQQRRLNITGVQAVVDGLKTSAFWLEVVAPDLAGVTLDPLAAHVQALQHEPCECD